MTLARLLYIGVALLHFPEREVWKKTPHQIMSLFRVHKEFNPDRFKPDPPKYRRDPFEGVE
jgi:hypothetical protein